MKKLFILSVLILLCGISFSQTRNSFAYHSVGDYTQTQEDALASTLSGMSMNNVTIYNTTLNRFRHWDGTSFISIAQTFPEVSSNYQLSLVSGTNIKTVNGNSLLGSGDIAISSAVAWGGITGTLSNQTDLNSALSGKQSTITTGTTAQYFTGNLSLATFPTTTAPFANSTNKNFVTDAQATVIGNTSGTNTGDNAVNSNYSGLVSNATHTGDATGSTALTVVKINGTQLSTLATGLLKNTTSTGVPSIAINSDLPVMTATVGGAVPTPPNLSTQYLKGNATWGTVDLAVTCTTIPNLSGDVTSSGNTTTLPNATVLAKVLTGYVSGAGTLATTDNILQAFNKLNGNDALKAPLISPSFTTPALGVATGTSLAVTGAITSSGAGIGYVTGAGGTVTQLTSRTTAVTLSKLSGTITMFSAAVAASASSTFTWTNTFIAATDIVIMQHNSATNADSWNVEVICGAGTATVVVKNISAASITEATPLKFIVIKASIN